ncbi:hypothetical protein BVY10_07940 [Pseudomonas amygdali pv. morsprunorum]|nr:hypothetical protein BVY10_07940 [Pseudomonas amygdali pv. morsprunorum]
MGYVFQRFTGSVTINKIFKEESMRDDLFANYKSLTAQEREALRRRLVERDLIEPAQACAEDTFICDARDRELIVSRVPGGEDNLEGIYPLTPLQEGLLYHHMLSGDADPYVLHQTIHFASRDELDCFVSALRKVISRHAILRSAMQWDGLAMPVQVVLRHVEFPLQEIEAPDAGADDQWLAAQAGLPCHRIDIGRAPLMNGLVARSSTAGWSLLVMSHHLIGDRTSLRVMQDELSVILRTGGHGLPTPPQFPDYALRVWGLGTQRDESFFRELLGDLRTPTTPFGLLEALDLRASLGEARLTLDASLVQRLREQASRRGLGMPALLHCAWALVLARLSGRDDVVFGTVLSGRMTEAPRTSQMLGMLINTLPFRLKLQGRSITECLNVSQSLLGKMIEHEHASLSLARRCSAIEGGGALTGALLDYRYLPGQQEPLSVQNSQPAPGSERTSFPLVLSVDDSGHALALTVQTLAHLDPSMITRYCERALERLADALEQTPGCRAGDLDVMPTQELIRLCMKPAPDRADRPAMPEACVHWLFEAQAARTPRAPCLINSAGSLDYAQLDRRANRLARHLHNSGMKREDRIALCMSRSVEMVIAMLAVMKAGGAYVPLDPGYPQARLRLLLGLARPALVIGGAQAGALALEQGLSYFDVRELEQCQCCAHEEALSPARFHSPTQTAYVMFTSGSTGEPKGVAVEHRSVVAFMRAQVQWCGLDETDRVLHFASPSFDNSIAEIFPALSIGAGIVVRPDGPIAPDAAFVGYLARHRVTVADLPTAFWHLWAQQLDAGDLDCLPKPPLRMVLAGGEKLQHEALRSWFRNPATNGIRLCDTYGLTEVTVNSIVGELTGEQARAQGPLPLGKALGDSRVCIVDNLGRLAPVGVVAEICVGGLGVARGYFDRPALTAARFVPDPFGPPGSRLYRTGDLGRQTRTGAIEYISRSDTQIKLRGYRIEPAEVESALRSVNGVLDAKVVCDKERLIAYVICDDAVSPSSDVLRARLSGLIPLYMVPSIFVPLVQWPVNTHGKVDLSALPSPSTLKRAERETHTPLTPMQALVAGVWSELLARDVIDIHDDFFALGGHSLLAIRVISRIRAATQALVSVRDVFAYPELKAFAQVLERTSRRPFAAIGRRTGPARMSFVQERMWFLSRIDPMQSLAYHLSGGLRITGALDKDALKAAFEGVIERHEVLRTVFPESHGMPHAVVVPVDSNLEWHTQVLCAGEEAECRLAGLFARAAQRPFDLAQGPLIRATLLQVTDDEHVLVVSMHHIICDGWSMSLIANELSGLYGHFAQGAAYPLAPMHLQYADYAVWQRETVVALDHDLRYWRKQLAGAPACLTLPTRRPRPAVQDLAGAGLAFTLDQDLTSALRDLSARHGATLYMILLGAWAVLLARLASQSSVVIGSPVANRPTLELEGLIGCFINTLALHVDLGDKPSVAVLLARIKGLVIESQERQHVPFEQVVETMSPVRSRAFNPLFQAMLVWQNTPSGSVLLDGLQIIEVHPQILTTHCDLALMMEERTDVIAGTLVYATALFDRSYIAGVLQGLKSVLIDMSEEEDICGAKPASPLRDSALAVASTAPKHMSGYLHDAVAHWALETPDAIAITDQWRSLCYRELDDSANRLARHLLSLGVGPGAHVAVAMGRSIELVVAIIAILKAGGGYVPLEPASARGRLQEIIDDSQPLLVLCDQVGKEALGPLTNVTIVDFHQDHALWSSLSSQGLCNSEVELTPQCTAYVIYTSGSTGRPKGVTVEHVQVSTLLESLAKTLGTDGSDVWSLFHSIAFDFSVWELFGALHAGARLLMVPTAVTRAPDQFYRLLCREGVTVLSQTPGAFSQVLDEHLRAPGAHRLRQVIFGGEQLDPTMLAGWFDSNPGGETRFTDMYGITEGAIHTTWRRLTVDDTRPGAERSVGRGIAGREVYVLDDQLHAVGEWTLGEIWIAGQGVARGYHRLPSLTAQRFVPDPFSPLPGARMYRSGDLGRLRADGELEFAGRADEQVKIRGFRIELGDIASRLAMHPSIAQSHVIARTEEKGGVRLVAYCRARHSDQLPVSPVALREYLTGYLPGYMVPVAYVQIENFSLTVNGKVDVAKLPPVHSDDYARRLYEPAQGTTEVWLAHTWSELLGVAEVSRHDDFFELGGHSLLVGQLTARIREKFELELPMADVFEVSVLHAFAARIDSARLVEFESFEI